MEGMTIKDIQPIRLQFSDHPAALARGDIDAYVGAEPAPGISLANGTGQLVEYPYSTPIGPLNMILSASEKAVKGNPERVKLVVDMHRKAIDYAMANPPQIVDMAMQKLGQQRKSIEKLKRAESVTIPAWFDYQNVSGLSREMQEKLSRVRPQTVGQASRIPGVTPAALSLIHVYIEIQARKRSEAVAASANAVAGS